VRLDALWRLLRRLAGRTGEERELSDEVEAFYAIHMEREMARGVPRDEARRRVRMKFGAPVKAMESVREVRVGASFETFLADLRYSARMLWKAPGFTFFAILTIALALGANTAIFTLVDGVLFRGLGYAEPERMVQLWEKPPDGLRNSIAPANYLDWARLQTSFEAMAAISGGSMSYLPVEGGGEPLSLRAGMVSAPYFDVFGVRAALGRTFARDEDQLGREKVVVLTHRLWTSLMGADARAVGREILLDGQRYTIIGVLPGAGEFDRNSTDLWIPLAFPPNPARNYHSYGAMARLKRGVTIEQARADLSAIAAGIAERYPDIKKGWGATIDRYADRVINDQSRLTLKVLLWAVVAVLLIGCANLTNLLMARATLRQREIGLRMALGARRERVVRMLLTESLLLSVAGAVAGLAVGHGLLLWIRNLLPPFHFPPEVAIELDGRVLMYLAAATLFTCVAVGLVPAVRASRPAADALRESSRSVTGARGQLVAQQVFIGAQVAVALVLLVGGGLLVRSLQKAINVDVGFDSNGLVAAYLPLPFDSPDEGVVSQYIERILEEVKSVPGIREAAVTTGLPFRGWGDGMPMRLAERPEEERGTGFKIISPGYFGALGLRLKAGRYLDARDTKSTPPVVVVNESFVRRHYPDGKAIGRRILVEKILVTRRGLGPQTAWEIVGVVADEKGRGVESLTDVGTYASFAQNPVVGLGLVARAGGDPAAAIRPMAQAVTRVEKTQVLDRPRTVNEWKAQALAGRRMATSMLTGLGVLAMLLACSGIYGVLSFVTARRTQEFGIRAALGASRPALLRLVLSGGTAPVMVGLVAGLGGALALGRFIRAMLFATEPVDPATLAAVSGLFLAVALAASLVPAWRASSADPMTALRHE